MARTIEVTPEQLRTAASKIESLATDYKTQYTNLYTETDALATTWSGADNVAFKTQIDGFKDDFQRMYSLMNQYATYLRTTAKSYDDTQDALEKEAKKLTN